MRTVLVVGAGGSLAQATSYRPVRNREHPPLDGDFFSKTDELSSGNRQIRTAVEDLKRSLGVAGSAYDPWIQGSVTMEQFFADVYYAVAGAATSSASLPIFIDTLRLYRRVLAQTTNWITSHREQGDLDAVVRKELANADEGLVVVTFNHDLVLERVASNLPRVANTYCLQSLYGDVALSPLNWNVARSHPNHSSGCQHQSPFTLLKLHGSMNWLMRSIKATPEFSTVFPPQRTKRKIYVGNHPNVLVDPKIRANRRPGGRSWYLWPLVVPPIYDKQRITGMNLLQEVWDRAESAISQADRLVLFGYSLPDADVLARQMLRTALRRNANLECVDCVNPDSSIAIKLRQVLDSKVVRLYSDAKSFAKYG